MYKCTTISVRAFKWGDRHLSVDSTFREDNSISYCVKRNGARLLASTKWSDDDWFEDNKARNSFDTQRSRSWPTMTNVPFMASRKEKYNKRKTIATRPRRGKFRFIALIIHLNEIINSRLPNNRLTTRGRWNFLSRLNENWVNNLKKLEIFVRKI